MTNENANRHLPVVWRAFTPVSEIERHMNPVAQLGCRVRRDIRTDPIGDLDFTPDAMGVVSHGRSGSVRVFDRQSGMRKSEHPNSAMANPGIWLTSSGYLLERSPKGVLLVVLDTAGLGSPKTFEYNRGIHVWAVTDRRLYIVSQVNRLQCFDLASGKCLGDYRLKAHTSPITLFRLDPDHTGFWTAGAGSGTIHFWKFDTGSPDKVIRARTRSPYLMCISPDSRRIAVRGIENRVELIDVATGSVDAELGCGSRYFDRMGFTPDGAFLVLFRGNGKAMRRIRIEDGTVRTFSIGHGIQPRLVFLSRFRTLVVADHDHPGRLTFIDTETDTLLGFFYNVPNGFLWEAPRLTKGSGQSLFWSDRPADYLEVFKPEGTGGNGETLVRESDPRFEACISDRLDQHAVMMRIDNRVQESERHRALYESIMNRTLVGMEGALWNVAPLPAETSRQGGER